VVEKFVDQSYANTHTSIARPSWEYVQCSSTAGHSTDKHRLCMQNLL